MKWLELHLDTQPAGIEPATELLSEYGIDSLMIDEEGDFKDFLENNHQYWDYVDDELMEQMHGKSRITFYLEDSAEGYNTLAQFRIGLSAFKKQHPEYAPLILSMENVEDADWENNWKQFYKPVEIGERLLVVPEWEQAQEDGRVKLVLNPGLTFGTGSHATTRLCLQALEQHIHGGEKVLDLGCGSGILSIAALLLVPHAIIRPIIGYGLHHWIPIQWLALHVLLIILTLCVALAAYIIADRTAPEPPETY